jgi:predicted transcriptional regulator
MGADLKRATVYLQPQLYKALRHKAAEIDRSVSEIINEAVRQALAEDAEDLAVFEERADEPRLPFEHVLTDMKKRGKL